MATKHRTGHLLKRGNNFYVRWVVEGKVFSKALRDENGKAITTRREAEDAQVRVMAPFVVADEATAIESLVGKLEGRRAQLARFEDEENPPLLIEQAWGEFVASPNRPDSGEETLYQYKCQWSGFSDWLAEKHSEIVALRDVSKDVAEEYASYLMTERKVSANTYNKHLNLLSLVFRVLRSKAKVSGIVWEDIQRKHIVTQSRRELTVEELKKVCQSATGELRTLLALGVYSGLRLGDCATLRWCEVDLVRGIIRRVPNKTARRNPKPVIVPIHPTLRGLLEEAHGKRHGEYVLRETRKLYEGRIDAVTDQIQAHFKACGIDPHKHGTGKDGRRAVLEVGFHSLRHTFVSLCRESNAPLAVVESIVGHSNPSMTRHYTHVGELAAGQAVAALPWVVGEAPPAVATKQHDPGAVLKKLRVILEEMTAANWEAKRAEAVALVPEAG